MPAAKLRHGNFSWVDLITPDTAAALAFYRPLFGWDFHTDMSPQGGYYMFQKDGRDVAGMTALPPGSDFHPCWTSYILVDDLDAVVARCGELGGIARMDPVEVGEAGRMCLIQDPAGGAVGLWEAGTFTGAAVLNEHGALAWNELVTRDVERARAFYGSLLGWEWSETRLPDGGTYHVCMVDGRPAGGMMRMTDQWPPGMTSYWEVYFAVDDVEAAHGLALEMGAGAFVPPTEISVGRFSVLRDPQGAAFTLFTPVTAG